MKNILVIKLRYIGDVLLATPALRALRERYPDACLAVAVNPGTEEILKWNPDADEVLVVARGTVFEQTKFIKNLRRRRFDCVIDLTDGDRSAFLTRVSGAPVRIGFNEENRWRGLLYTSVVQLPPRVLHRVERDLEALRPLGIEPKWSPPVLRVTEEDAREGDRLLAEAGVGVHGDRPLVLLQPGARYWFKAWPAERFAQLADRLADTFGCRILIGGDSSEVELAESVRKHARSAPVNLAGRTTLLQLAGILRRCDLFIGNDNGPMHMAAALGVPVVALFGPSDPAVWGPRGGRTEVLYKGLDCRGCFRPDCFRGEQNCMKLISVDEVFAVAQRCLSQG